MIGIRIAFGLVLNLILVCETRAQYTWQPQPKKAALMVVVAHPDDEVAFMGGAITYYAQVLKLPVVWVLMTTGNANGQGKVRIQEAQCAAMGYGLPNAPIFGDFPDTCFGSDLACNWKGWGGRDRAAAFVTALVRKYKPDVLLSQDLNGDYGHPNHMGAAFASMDAYFGAGNPSKFPLQLDSLTTWSPKKLYLHGSAKSYHAFCASNPANVMCASKCNTEDCLTVNRDTAQIIYFPPGPKLSSYCHSWMMKSPVLGGASVFDVTNEAGNCHVSQLVNNWCSPCNLFDLWDSKVGADLKGQDLFENLDLKPYQNPTSLGRSGEESDFRVSLLSRGGSWTFRVRVEKAQRVSLRLFNLEGRNIATVFEGWSEAGDLNLEWNMGSGKGSGTFSGLCIAKLRIGAREISRPLMVGTLGRN